MCVVGAGAVGGHLAARLHASGAEVSLLARGGTLAAIRARGLILRDPNGEICVPIAVAERADELGPQDLVIFAVKAPDLLAAASAARPLLAPGTAAVFVMNGIPWWYERAERSSSAPADEQSIADRAMAAVIAPASVLGAVVYSMCSVPEPGVVLVRNAVSKFCLGDTAAAAPSERTLALAQALRSGAMQVDVSQNIRDQIWEKLILLYATCPLSLLSETAPIDLFKEPECIDASKRLMREGISIATALGRSVKIDLDAILAASLTSEHRPSILQDLDKRRRMEVDAMFTIPLRMAVDAGVPAPTLALLTSLIKLRARSAGLYA
jgi:2-dehydropantoate 2-reductase